MYADVDAVWYAIQAFTGGQLISVLLSTLSSGYQNMPNHFPKSASMTTKQFVGFVIYCVGTSVQINLSLEFRA